MSCLVDFRVPSDEVVFFSVWAVLEEGFAQDDSHRSAESNS